MIYAFEGVVWRANAEAAWRFVTVPQDMSQSIRTLAGAKMNAFGSLRVSATVGPTTWKTSLFFDTKANAFLLPLKADVRRKAKLRDGDRAAVRIEIEL